VNCEKYDCDPMILANRKDKKRFENLFEREPSLSSVPEIWFRGSSIEEGMDGSGDWEETLGRGVAKLKEPVREQPKGKTTEELFENCGGSESVVVLKAMTTLSG